MDRGIDRIWMSIGQSCLLKYLFSFHNGVLVANVFVDFHQNLTYVTSSIRSRYAQNKILVPLYLFIS